MWLLLRTSRKLLPCCPGFMQVFFGQTSYLIILYLTLGVALTHGRSPRNWINFCFNYLALVSTQYPRINELNSFFLYFSKLILQWSEEAFPFIIIISSSFWLKTRAGGKQQLYLIRAEESSSRLEMKNALRQNERGGWLAVVLRPRLPHIIFT